MIGKTIVIVMACFMTMILYFVYTALSTDFNLVSQNYYQDEALVDIHNQQQLNDFNNRNSLKIIEEADQFRIFSDLSNSVDTLYFSFYSPRTDHEDHLIKVPINKQNEFLSIAHLRSGNWKVDVTYFINKKVHRRKLRLTRG